MFYCRFVTFSDSSYKIPAAIAALEKQHKQGDMIMIEGKTTGMARVSVALAHLSYKVK